ncbi:hypothetical protein ACFV7Q_30820 [Streptomyces sp. NPDC059851]|uniref:hypothetical protein n=1 Tax=Streptomyces sp. NPDC059851 TaxID=3346971 RepID=UPI003662345E
MRTDSALTLAGRLEEVDWIGSFDQARSRVALMREFLRRSALWARATGSAEWPFFDIAARIDPSARIDADVVTGIAEKAGLQQPVVLDTLEWSLNFAVLSDIRADLPDLPEPFVPLVLLSERGGGFGLDGSGHIEVDMAAISKGCMEDALERTPLDLSEASLSALDAG